MLCDNLVWKVGGRSKRDGTYVYLWLIHVDGWQKPTKRCKAIILQLKNKEIEYNQYPNPHPLVLLLCSPLPQ